jgi:hypothetical protein
LRDECVGVTWELNMAQNLVIWPSCTLESSASWPAGCRHF